MTSGSLSSVIVRILAQKARDMGLIHTLGAIFHISLPRDIGCCDQDSVQANRCMVDEPALSMYIFRPLYASNFKH